MGEFASREEYLIYRKCIRKKGWWKTLKAAHRAAKKFYKRTGIRLYPYRCSYCHNVHLTKQISAKGKIL